MEESSNQKPKYVSIRTHGGVRFVYDPTITRHHEKDLMLEVIEIIRQAGIEYMGLQERKNGSAKHGKDSQAAKAERLVKSYANLIVFLNQLGHYPKSIEEAKQIAKELLDQGWEE